MNSIPHDSAKTHVTGQSEFIDDRAQAHGEVFVEIVMSARAHAKIKSINIKSALSAPGVITVLTAKDVIHNHWGTIFKDQPILADQKVSFVGEPIALIVAESREQAARAKGSIKIEYQELNPILTIQDAIQAKSFIGDLRHIKRGAFDSALAKSPRRLSGKITIRGAEHFYLENQAAIAYPQDNGCVEVHSSSQHPTETQHVVAHALGLPYHQVTCIVKRMGGAFGGKESQAAPIAAYAALAAAKLKRPARIVLTKDDDMIITGKRNPFENEYHVGFDDSGKIQALKVNLFSDGGAYADLSTAIMERAMLHCDNAYYIPNIEISGQVCRTNYHPHTAFRGFGGPKGVATIEHIIEEIAHALGKDPLDIRKINCYAESGERAITPYGQTVENNCLPRLFESLEKSCDYRLRRSEIEKHNRASHTLRGLSMTAVKFGISFTTRFLNQANALVIVHRDGSIQISTGATEMGQGVNTRIAQIVADELGISRQSVTVGVTATDKNANTSPTAASSGTDLNGAAALLAARKIKARLSALAIQLFQKPETKWAKNTAGLGTEPELELQTTKDGEWPTGIATYFGVEFKDGKAHCPKSISNPSRDCISFGDLVNEAYLNRQSLSEYAHFKFDRLSFNKLTGEGRAFLYFTQGVAATEVSVDTLTGETKVLRTDILMDLGNSINEGLDLGQITGGYVQGMGWVTAEKLFYDNSGSLKTHAPSTYKIPNVQDTPRIFNVALFSNDKNHVNVRGTKAVGEPPLLLAISAWTAIEDALKSRTKAFPRLEIPATQEQVMRALYPREFGVWE